MIHQKMSEQNKTKKTTIMNFLSTFCQLLKCKLVKLWHREVVLGIDLEYDFQTGLSSEPVSHLRN